MSESKITFTSADTGLSSFKFILEAAENGGKMIFAPDERARLKLYPGGQNPQISTSWGSAEIFMKGVKQTFTEYIAFRSAASANTTYYIEKLISASWEGTGEGRPLIYGSRIILPDLTTGVLKVQYETSYDLIDVTCSHPTYLLVSAESETLSGDFLVDFTDGYLTDIYDKDVVMTVRDACSKETLPNASVYINGSFSGRTDSAGLIRLGSMKSGTYALRITRDGYTDTDKDTISNDYFTVE
jgi:hypothetical protein